jgi:hypothetical protein
LTTINAGDPGMRKLQAMAWLRGLGYVFASLVLAWGLTAVVGHWRWNGKTRELESRLEESRRAPATARFDARELQGLPPPVQRYFRNALIDGQPIVTGVTIETAGRFNLGESEDNWKPFRSHQRVTTVRPGFVWDGRVSMFPGLLVRVHDAYLGGEGLLNAALLGLFALADQRGTREMAKGELMRWFAEAAWYPTALLPSQGVRWEPISDNAARATLSDGAVVISLTFTFGDDGSMLSVRAEARGRTVGGKVMPTPWEGTWHTVQTRGGMRVPTVGEVAWITPQGRKAYWRGTVTSIDHQFVR